MSAPPALRAAADFAIGGVLPREVVRPATREQAAEALARAARDGRGVVPWGGGTWLPRETAPARYDLALDLGGLDRIVEHEPDDFTVTVECGVTVERLRAALAAHRQELPLEAPLPARATIGGVLAGNVSGPRRYRFGSPRDRILGARFALGDGTLARTGGKVVKNVAGYAIHRLACGSRGALFAILEASFKVAAAPELRRTLLHPAAPAALGDPARWAFLPRLEPAFVTVSGGTGGAPFDVAIGLEDDAAWVEEQTSRVAAALGAPAAVLEGDAAAAFTRKLTDLAAREEPHLVFTTADNTPAALAPVIAAGAPDLLFHAAAGRLHVFGAPPDPHGFVTAMAGLGFQLIESGGLDLPPAPAGATLPHLRARIRDALDPRHVFAYGDRWAG